MAESSSSSVTTTHLRSISLPTRLIHPKAQRVEEELQKIQGLNSSSSSRIQLGLAKLVELYDFINEQVIDSPQGQQVLRVNKKLVEHALDESIVLLDVADFTRDLIETFMEQIQVLQSALRRRGRDLSNVQAEIQSYSNFQKKIKNVATRQAKSITRTQTKKKSPVLKRFSDSSMVSNILKQSNASAISILQSVLQFLSSCHDENQKKNGGIRSFYGRIMSRKITKVIDVQTMLGRLVMLNVSLEAINDELSYLSRILIKQRASLLNIVTP